jgi:1,2-diacylglycerol 3-beta-galactosyltransferase
MERMILQLLLLTVILCTGSSSNSNALEPLLRNYGYHDINEGNVGSSKFSKLGDSVKNKLINVRERLFSSSTSKAGGSSTFPSVSTSNLRTLTARSNPISSKSVIDNKSSEQRNRRSSSSSSSGSRKDVRKILNFFKGGNDDKKKLLILMCDTGGGHRASAQALDQALQEQFPNKIDVEIMDIWTKHAVYPFNNFVPWYRYAAKHPPIWRFLYSWGSNPISRRFTEMWSSAVCYKHFKKAIEGSDPDFVVSVHPLTQLIPLSIVHEMNIKREYEGKEPIPFVTVVTDLGGAHKTWFDPRVVACYVPSEAVRKEALKAGLHEDKIIMKGLPIRPSFWKAAKPKVQVRETLGLPKDGKTVLLMGGGDGVGGIGQIANECFKNLKKLQCATQIIVICEHNQQVSQTLQSKLLPQTDDKHKVVIKGFVNNIDEYMTASDCLITKAGPGTIAESMIRGLPMVLSSYLPGQEAGNVPYVTEGGFGIYEHRPQKIARTVTQLFTNEAKLVDMSIKAKMQSHPEATVSIARDIGLSLISLPEIRSAAATTAPTTTSSSSVQYTSSSRRI